MKKNNLNKKIINKNFNKFIKGNKSKLISMSSKLSRETRMPVEDCVQELLLALYKQYSKGEVLDEPNWRYAAMNSKYELFMTKKKNKLMVNVSKYVLDNIRLLEKYNELDTNLSQKQIDSCKALDKFNRNWSSTLGESDMEAVRDEQLDLIETICRKEDSNLLDYIAQVNLSSDEYKAYSELARGTFKTTASNKNTKAKILRRLKKSNLIKQLNFNLEDL